MASNATVAAAFTAGAVISAIVVRQYYRCLAAELARIKEEPPLALPCADIVAWRGRLCLRASQINECMMDSCKCQYFK